MERAERSADVSDDRAERSYWRDHDGNSDIRVGIAASHVWSALGWHDIRQRYRRSVLGPFWFTLSTIIMVGVLNSLFHTPESGDF
jgi:hypothetical protein